MVLKRLANTKVSEVQQRVVVTVPLELSLEEVVACLFDAGRGRSLVVNELGELVGVFTQHDLMNRVDLENLDWQAVPVAEVMTKMPTTVRSTTSLASTLRLMRHGHFRSLPVIDETGCPTGLIAIRDILIFLADEFPAEFLNLPPEPSAEPKSLWGG